MLFLCDAAAFLLCVALFMPFSKKVMISPFTSFSIFRVYSYSLLLSILYIHSYNLQVFFLSGLLKETAGLCNKVFQSCSPISVAVNRQGTSDVSIPLYPGSLSPSYPSCSLVKLPVDFSGLMPIAKGVFSCKAEATCDGNVS